MNRKLTFNDKRKVNLEEKLAERAHEADHQVKFKQLKRQNQNRFMKAIIKHSKDNLPSLYQWVRVGSVSEKFELELFLSLNDRRIYPLRMKERSRKREKEYGQKSQSKRVTREKKCESERKKESN